MRKDGRSALVHTAAASNLGQMLVKLCAAEGIPLVNVVRSSAQEEVLRQLGAVHVCDSSRPTFEADLTEAVAAVSATLAFDALGGGPLVSRLFVAMEHAANRSGGLGPRRYGSSVHKQVYVYGTLNPGPIEVQRAFGAAWSVSGWLVSHFLANIGVEAANRLRARVVSEVTTTFASSYARTISLSDAIDPEIMVSYSRKATGEKYLINPQLGGGPS